MIKAKVCYTIDVSMYGFAEKQLHIEQNTDFVMGGDGVGERLAYYCRRVKREELLEEWDRERNAPLTPDQVSYGSARKVWWRCGEGHEWQAPVKARTSGSGCPICSGRVSRKRLERYQAMLAQSKEDARML